MNNFSVTSNHFNDPEFIRYLMRKSKITQLDLAKHFNRSPTRISQAFQGKAPNLLNKIKDFLLSK